MQVTKWTGKPITKPGWYSGIPIEVYHSAGICDGKAVSSSDLRTCWSKSPAHMLAKWCENPKREPREVTRPMILGQAAHHLFLGEDKFDAKFVAQPPEYPDKKTGELKKWHNGSDHCKAWNDKWSSHVIVTPDEFVAIRGMAKSLAGYSLVQQGLLAGHVETSGFIKDAQTGLWIKVRPDVIPVSGPDFVDLKTARDVTSFALMRSISEYGYHQQGALIHEVCDVLGQPFESFNLMFVETSNPYCARNVPLADKDLDLGRQQNRLMLRAIKGCMDLDHFPGPGEGENNALPISEANRSRIEERLKYERATA